MELHSYRDKKERIETMSQLSRRYDFVLLFDVQDGNPNGDPDAGNLPRIDPETMQGLITDVCLKRKIRNYVQLTKGTSEGYDIYVKEKAILNASIEQVYKDLKLQPEENPESEAGSGEEDAKAKGKGKGKKATGRGSADAAELARTEMCRRYFDVRTFGAVMSTGQNAGQVRGPVQLTFARSIEPVVSLEHTITRVAVATQKEADEQGGENRTMGRKNTIPYGLYRAHGFVSPAFAGKTGFSDDDLALLWESLEHMFDHDHSASRGLMALRKLIVFEHESALGNAPAHRLFESVTVAPNHEGRPARRFADYTVAIGNPPAGVKVIEKV